MPKIGQIRTDLPLLSPWQQHVEDWKGCTRCDLHKNRSVVVLARGSIPADLLFIGEAPGFTEDALAQPFVGPAGQLLDRIINRALLRDGKPIATCCFSNLVCCIPVDPENAATKVEQPDHPHILACQPRLVELINMVRPKLLVRVGKLAKDYLEGGTYRSWKHSIKLPQCCDVLDILHPAFILRTNVANREVFTQRTVVQIENAAEDAIARPGWGPEDSAIYGLTTKIRTRNSPNATDALLEEMMKDIGKDRPVWDLPEDEIPF